MHLGYSRLELSELLEVSLSCGKAPLGKCLLTILGVLRDLFIGSVLRQDRDQ
jgi:hypothetical protein